MSNAFNNAVKMANIVSATDYGADPAGATDSTAAIQAAINAVAAKTASDDATGFDSFAGVVELPTGTYLVSDTLTLKRGVTLRGAGRRASMLLVDDAEFPADSRVITIGELGSNDFAYNTRIESLFINCNFRADLVAVESDHAAEGSGMHDVMVRGTFRPIRFYRQSGLTEPASPTESIVYNCEFWLEGSGGPAAPRYAIDLDNCEQSLVFRDITILAINDNAGSGSAAFRINECAAEIQHVHCEKIETCVLVAGAGTGSARAMIRDIEHYNGVAQYAVRITNDNAATLVQVENVFIQGTGTVYAVSNSVNSEAVSDTTLVRMGRYSYISSNNFSQASITELRIGRGAKLRRVLEASASLNFGSIAAGAHSTLTISVSGAVVGDSVAGSPEGTTTLVDLGGGALIQYHYGVTATDTVSVRAFNCGTASGDPSAATHNISVIGYA